MTGSDSIDAERAFTRSARARRRAAVVAVQGAHVSLESHGLCFHASVVLTERS